MPRCINKMLRELDKSKARLQRGRLNMLENFCRGGQNIERFGWTKAKLDCKEEDWTCMRIFAEVDEMLRELDTGNSGNVGLEDFLRRDYYHVHLVRTWQVDLLKLFQDFPRCSSSWPVCHCSFKMLHLMRVVWPDQQLPHNLREGVKKNGGQKS